jgi:hypothetical protein
MSRAELIIIGVALVAIVIAAGVYVFDGFAR